MVISYGSSVNSSIYTAYVDSKTNQLAIIETTSSGVGGRIFSNLGHVKDLKSLDMAIDSKNNLYIAYSDADNGNRLSIKKYNGAIWNYVGDAGMGSSNLDSTYVVDYLPNHTIMFDYQDNLYVAYSSNLSTGNISILKLLYNK